MNGELGETRHQLGEVRPAPMVPPGQHRGRMLLFESILIVLSVLLGFALQAWAERRAERMMAAAALENFRVEIEANLNDLERVQPRHAAFADRLAEALADSASRSSETAFAVFARNLPEGGLQTPPLKEAAWETATSTGALRLLDYDLAAVLSETYLVQRSTLGPTVALLSERLYAPGTFENEAREAFVNVHHMLLVELAGREAYLTEVYRNTLARLSEASR
jgi:hypothetical protein